MSVNATFADISAYIEALRICQEKFGGQVRSDRQFTTHGRHASRLPVMRAQALIAFRSVWDVICLIMQLLRDRRRRNASRIVFTQRAFCFVDADNELQDRIARPLVGESSIFVNQSKSERIDRINGQRVFNTGGAVQLLRRTVFRHLSSDLSAFVAYRLINDIVLRFANGREVLSLCFYDMNGLSLAFSRFRSRFVLSEVQHGSIINFPPYEIPSPIRLADRYYVKNEATVGFLKGHLCRDFCCDYVVFPIAPRQAVRSDHLNVLYASTIEFNGLHPVFLEYLQDVDYGAVNIIIRLHPRERDQRDHFAAQLASVGAIYTFDDSPDWIEANPFEDLVVVSPWSSTLEDAHNIGLMAIAIDPVGRDRYAHLSGSPLFVYSERLRDILCGATGELRTVCSPVRTND